MREILQKLFEQRVNHFVSDSRRPKEIYPKAEKKLESMMKRSAEIVKVKSSGTILDEFVQDDFQVIKYQVHFQYLINQKGTLYMEEEVEERMGKFYRGLLVMDEEMDLLTASQPEHAEVPILEPEESAERINYQYNRLRAVQYAETWWNSYNPAYKKFENDCTNFISQCLREGGAPMRGFPKRGSGWWLQSNNWSYSWAIAHSLRLYLPSSTIGLRAKEVSSPEQLMLGDIICYDFEGDGRFNHNTIVTGKDAYGMPLVNAHTYNSRMRYWAYEDSSAYTPNIKYKFFTIVDS